MRDAGEIVVMMVEKGRVPDTSMYNLMMKGYCENDEVGMALDMFKEMVKKRAGEFGELLLVSKGVV